MRTTLSQAIHLLRSGEVVAVPTETVYGLAACLDQPAAIEKIFDLKKRPRTNPLIIHISDLQQVSRYCNANAFPPDFEALAQEYWPGPLTCILPVNSDIPSAARSGLATAGFRMPSHALTLQLIRETGPLVMPSANLSGRPSATRAEHVEEDFSHSFPVLDGGICARGVESTILAFQESEWVVLRLGALPPEVFAPILGYTPRVAKKIEGERPLCPGQHFRHYAPRARLILGDVRALDEDDTLYVLGFKERSYPEGKRVILLGSLSRAEEVAENLYDALRQLDIEGASQAWVDTDFPHHGLWQTIAERLLRAAE